MAWMFSGDSMFGSALKSLAATAVILALVCAPAVTAWAAPITSSSAVSPQEPEKKPDDEKKDEKDKKKKKKDGGDDPLDTRVFSARVANNILNEIRDGLEAHSQRMFLGAFDADQMDGYLDFEEQIEAYFDRYEGFRVHFRISSTEIQEQKGIVMVDVQLEQIPAGMAAPPQRKSGLLRFELERGSRGWKVVDVNPRGFFS